MSSRSPAELLRQDSLAQVLCKIQEDATTTVPWWEDVNEWVDANILDNSPREASVVACDR